MLRHSLRILSRHQTRFRSVSSVGDATNARLPNTPRNAQSQNSQIQAAPAAPQSVSFLVDQSPMSSLSPVDTFLRRHVGPDQSATREMLECIGANSIPELIGQTIPPGIRRDVPLEMHFYTQSEATCQQQLRQIAAKNVLFKNFIGMGYHGTVLPGVIERNLLENPTWYTPYTPYQAEIAQGRLESQLNFQTMIMELSGMDLANASLLDEGTAAAEAMNMIYRATEKQGSRKIFFVSDKTHPQTIDVMAGRAASIGLRLIVGDHTQVDFSRLSKQACGALVQYPDTYGYIDDYEQIAADLHENGAQLAVAADPLALTVIRPPGEWGADVCVGTTQRFGVPMGFGGPAAAFLATTKENMRKMPGRIIGVSRDWRGDRCLRMTLQTREQHVRKDKATSNICTAQALLANIASMYGVYHGPTGLIRIARRVKAMAQRLEDGLGQLGYTCLNGDRYFDTLHVSTKPVSADVVIKCMHNHMLNVRPISALTVGVTLDETTSVEDVNALLTAFREAFGYKRDEGQVMLDDTVYTGELSHVVARTSHFMTQQVSWVNSPLSVK
eukprot:GHVN01019078.1.p1 GENE.GHVN01019078.1~~GHVN01019078.1.p1  ORF type:complete len:556 (+),score=57.94 GHVN01019078.1:3139-4806(+)